MNREIEIVAESLFTDLILDVHTYRDALRLADAMMLPGETSQKRDAIAAAIWDRALKYAR